MMQKIYGFAPLGNKTTGLRMDICNGCGAVNAFVITNFGAVCDSCNSEVTTISWAPRKNGTVNDS